MISNHPLAALLCALSLAACSEPRSVQTAKTAVPKAAPVGSYLAGDMHVHNDHSSDGSALRQGLDGRGPGNVSVADQIGQGVQNNLAWMPLTDHRTYDQHYDPLWTSDALLLIPGEEANGSPHANVLGHVDYLVQGSPYTGRPGWSVLQTSIWDAHSQGAVWSHNHPDDGHVNEDGTPNERANAVGADVVEVWNKASGIETELRYAENRWNAGYRFGGVGASDNHFRELWTIAGPGTPATMAFASDESERAILQGLQRGRTVIAADNNGLAPLVTLEADLDGDAVYEAIAGDEVVAAAGTAGKLRVRIQRGTGATVTIYRNPGRTVPEGTFASYQPILPDDRREFDVSASAEQSWYYVEVRGPGPIDAVNTEDLASALNPLNLLNVRRAMTSPIFIGPMLAMPQGEQPVPADVGIDDGAVLALGELQAFAGFPDLALSGGVTHLVAEQHREGATQVFYRQRRTDGSFGPAVDLAPQSRSARFPRIAASGSRVWVVWQDERAGQLPRRPAIYLRQSSDGGASWQPEQLLRGIAGRAERPVIALSASGAPLVAWQEIRPGEPFDVFAQLLGVDAEPINLSRSGKSFNAANPLDTRSALWPASLWPAVSVRADGLMALAYQDNRDDLDPLWTGQVLVGDGTEVDDWQIRVHTRAATAASWSPPVVIGAADRADRHPSLAFNGSGVLLATWDSKDLNPAGGNRSIRYSFSSDDGASFVDTGAPPAIGLDEAADSQHPRLGLEPDGRLRAVWTDNRSSDWRWRTATALLDAGTTPSWSAATLLMGQGVNTWPATASGSLVFASTRNAARMQRDVTQQVLLLATAAAVAPPTEVPPVIAPPPSVPGNAAGGGRFGGGALGLMLLAGLLGSVATRRQGRQQRAKKSRSESSD